MEGSITSTIRDIDEREWNALSGTDLIDKTYGWFKTVEESGMRDMYYVVVKDKKLAAVACCFPFNENLYIDVPLLEVRSPLRVSSAFFSKTPEHTFLLIKGLEYIRERKKAKGISILELGEDELTSLREQVSGFTWFPMADNTYLDLGFADFDDYLGSLGATARRSVKKTLNRAEKRWKVHMLVTNEFSQWKSVAHRLQGYTCQQRGVTRTHLTEEFYDALERNLKEHAELLIILKDDIPLACGLSLNSPKMSQHIFPGVDPQYRDYQAYFLLYYEGIKRAIEKGQKRVYFGPTTYEFKEKIGCKVQKLFGFAKMTNPLISAAFKSYIFVSRLRNKKF